MFNTFNFIYLEPNRNTALPLIRSGPYRFIEAVFLLMDDADRNLLLHTDIILDKVQDKKHERNILTGDIVCGNVWLTTSWLYQGVLMGSIAYYLLACEVAHLSGCYWDWDLVLWWLWLSRQSQDWWYDSNLPSFLCHSVHKECTEAHLENRIHTQCPRAGLEHSPKRTLELLDNPFCSTLPGTKTNRQPLQTKLRREETVTEAVKHENQVKTQSDWDMNGEKGMF